MKIKNLDFDRKHTYVCGIINITPDSFSDGGRYKNLDDVLYRVDEMIYQGAEMIDIGGESTRPSAESISDTEEIDRVLPVLEAVCDRFDTVVSLDTYHSKTALEGIKCGVDIINDVNGLSPMMADVIREYNPYYVLTFNYDLSNNDFNSIYQSMVDFLGRLDESNIDKSKVIFDPGVGFNKSKENDLNIMANLAKIQGLGYPVMLGASRKSCIDYVMDLPVNERVEGTLATTACAVNGGTNIVRVHDVLENARFIKMYERIRFGTDNC